MNRLLLNKPGRRTKLIYEDGRPIFLMEQDADPVIDHAHELGRDSPARPVSHSKARHVAEIPTIIYYELLRKFGPPRDNPSDWKKWFNDPENRAFRVWGGRV